MDIVGLTEQMRQDGAFTRIINNPLAQFGPEGRNYLGATLMPEQTVPENQYTESAIKYRTPIANSAGRYSPVQLKAGVYEGSMNVRLGESDIGSEFKAKEYDALIKLLEKAQVGTGGGLAGTTDRPTMAAMAAILGWVDATVNLPLLEFNELQRWQAIVSAVVNCRGDGGFSEDITYPTPTGHRPNAGGTWSDDTYDPYLDFMAAQAFLAAKGFSIGRIIASTPVMAILALNAKIRARLGLLSIVGGAITGLAGHASLGDINALIAKDNLPPIEKYDLQYRTQSGTGYFLPRNVMVFVATTNRDMSIDLGDLQPMFADGGQVQNGVIPVSNVLGYTAIGRPAGQSLPGRRSLVTPYENKPPRIEAEGSQTSLPVITEPEAVYVIGNIG